MTTPSWNQPWQSRAVLLPADDVDTDQIIPARFLKVSGREGLGRHLFADWTFAPDGAPRRSFPLNNPGARGAGILVAGRNFGCGSSREHAPWALVDFGFSAIVARSFADIFRANALKNRLLPIALAEASWSELVTLLAFEPDLVVEIDLPNHRVGFGSADARFEIDPFARHCLIEGVDELGFLLSREPAIARYERGVPPLVWDE